MNTCNHECSGNCRREGCNCECGEWHRTSLGIALTYKIEVINAILDTLTLITVASAGESARGYNEALRDMRSILKNMKKMFEEKQHPLN